MNMQEWMTANPRPDRPQFDGQAYHSLAPDAMQGYRQDFRTQLGDWRDQMHDWRSGRKDWRQDGQGGQMPRDRMPNTQFPLNPAQGFPTGEQQIPGSSYGYNLGQVLSQFPNGLHGLRNGQPGPNPGY